LVFANYYPMLWIHLNNSLKMESIYARRFTGGLFWHNKDETGFYSFYGIDDDGRWIPNPYPYIDNKIFWECFD
jgi:hypothetical protein